MNDYDDLIEALVLGLQGIDNTAHQSVAELLRPGVIAALEEVTEANCFIGIMPNVPDLCVCLNDSGGGEQDDRLALDTSSLQIRSRGDYNTAHKILNKIKLAFQAIPRVVLSNGSTLVGIWVKSNIAYLGRDTQDRDLFTSNYRIVIEPLNKGNRN